MPKRLFGFVLLMFLLVQPVSAKTVEELRQELNQRRERLQQAEKRISEFKERIQLKKQEARTLESQLEIMDDTIEELDLTIGRTVAEIEETAIEIESVSEDVKIKEEEINKQRDLLGEYIRALHTVDRQSTVAVFLKYDTFSDVIHEASTFEELHGRAQTTFDNLKKLHQELTDKQRDLQDFQATLKSLQQRQEGQQKTVEAQRTAKNRILELTNSQEKQYQGLLKQSQQTHQQAQADIAELDSLIREELKKQGVGELPSVGTMDWPIDPVFGVSCEFHCGGYPFAYLIGAHSGTDIPAYVGTPIKAPADGYVARTHDSGGSGYSYIMLIHGEGVSTVFGHVSGFAVSEGQAVKRGTVIGYTGGAPGTRGAGLSSGPHLHFEVRKNNVAVNSRNYLR